MNRRPLLCLSIAIIVFVAGCLPSRTTLPVAPNVLRDGSGTRQLEELPPEQKTPEMKVFYVTDRASERQEGRLVYTHQRAGAVTYGVAIVSFPKDVTWQQLAAYSSRGDSADYVLRVTDIQPLGSFVPTMDRMGVVNGQLVVTGLAERDREEDIARAIIGNEMANQSYHDVYLFVHGFNNTFDDAVLRMAGLWHYLGRRGLPVVYTWPAGRGGPFGYFYDRESGEFTIYSLKRTLKVLASSPQVQRVHLIAHSRGTDVVTSALRELNIEYVAAGLNPQKELKLDTLVLAAPDLDRDVFRQRFLTENLLGIARQSVLYCSTDDAALRLSAWLFGSSARLGRVDPKTFSPKDRALLKQLPGVQVVITDVQGFSTSHDYVFNNPAALSDLVLVLRDGKSGGAANGRPLKPLDGLWLLDNTYEAQVGKSR